MKEFQGIQRRSVEKCRKGVVDVCVKTLMRPGLFSSHVVFGHEI